jgi:hypothetical protein
MVCSKLSSRSPNPSAGDKTKVRFDLEVDPAIPIPGFLLKRTLKGAMETATDGLRKQVLKLKKG